MTAIKWLSILSPIICSLIFISSSALFLSFIISVRNEKLNRNTKIYGVVLLISFSLNFSQGYSLKKYLLNIKSDKNIGIEIYWNGRKLNEGEKFFSTFSAYESFKLRSGSHPEDENKMKISYGNKSLDFILKNDSRENNLYWVFYPKFKCKAEVGFVYIDQHYFL